MMIKRKKSTISGEAKDAFILYLPLVLLMVAFSAIPVLSNFYYSFTKWNGIGKPEFIGLENYFRMVQDTRFLSSLKNLGILIMYIPFGVLLPLIIAAILRKGIAGWTVFRWVYYLPNVLGAVLLGIMFSLIFSQVGPITEILKLLSVTNAEKIYLLGKSTSAINTMAFLFVVWMRLGFGIIFFLSAMSVIDITLYEAAEIDGANSFQKFIHITVPSIMFPIQFFVVLAFIEVFARMYGLLFTLTRGGPGYATYTLEYGIFNLSFNALQKGYASAWSVALFFFCAIIAMFQIRLIKRGNIL